MTNMNKVYTCVAAIGAKSLVAELVRSVGDARNPFDQERICPFPANAVKAVNSQRLISPDWIQSNTGGLVVGGSVLYREPGTFFFTTTPGPALPLLRTLSTQFPAVTLCVWLFDRFSTFAATAVFMAGSGIVREVFPCSKEGRQVAAMTQRASALRAEKRAAKVYNYPSAPVNVTPAIVPPTPVVKPPTVISTATSGNSLTRS